MAISTARRRSRIIRPIAPPREPELPAEPLPIGLPNLDVTGCPVCGRPIAVGAASCPGCGTRLLLGVPLRRAGAFVTIGAAVGMLLGGAAVAVVHRPAVVASVEPPTAPVVPAAAASTAPEQTAPSAASVAPVPGDARAALGQVLAVNSRLRSRAADLRAEIAAPRLDSFAVATTVRSLAADAVVATGVVPLLGAWPPAADVATRLRAYYAQVGATAGATLSSSLTDARAYRAGAASMLRLLAKLPPLDDQARSIAADAGLDVDGRPPGSAAP